MVKPLCYGRGPFGNFYFTDFLVSESNRVAFEAAGQVVDSPGTVCNPLTLVNEFSGNGATHLTAAIGNKTVGRNPDARIWMLSAEKFTSEFRLHSERGMLQVFRDHYLSCDAFLVDGLGHFIHNDQALLELASIASMLISKDKQVVFNGCSALATPKSLRGIVNAGTTRQILMPDIELRREKVLRLAARDRINITEQAIDLIATTCTRSIREVQGAYLRSCAIAVQRKYSQVCIDCTHEALSPSTR